MQGWIKLHRKIRNNPIFSDPELYRLATICLTEAYHKEVDQPIGNQVVKIMPGQFPTGRFDLHQKYNLGLKSKYMVSEKTTWRWLKKLEKLEFLTIKSTNKYSVVSINNWCEYQKSDQQMTNRWPTDDQQMTTNKNVKNVENEKDIYSLFDHWNSKGIIQHRKMNQKMQSHIKARLDEYSIDELKNAIDNYETILKNDEYFWTYKWTLQELMRPDKVTKFLEENDPFSNYRKNKTNRMSKTKNNDDVIARMEKKWGLDSGQAASSGDY